MMNGTEYRRAGQSRLVAITFTLIAFLFLTWQPAQGQWATNGTNIHNTNTGNVGIGTTSPLTILHTAINSTETSFASVTTADLGLVLQNTNATAGNMEIISFVNSGGGGQAHIGTVNVGSSTTSGGRLFYATRPAGGSPIERMRIDANGNVGIGTTNPLGILDVQRSVAGSMLTRLFNTNALGTTTLRLAMQGTSSSSLYSNIEFSDMDYWIGSITADRTNGLRFRTGVNIASGESGLFDRLTILPGGNVGIGITSPATRLHVDGDVTVTGNISARYQDVAEWVPSRQRLTAGTVVVLDTSASNHVQASTESYDTRVAGVVSAQPGLILGEGGEGRVMVATTGRVRVRVDATRAPIRVGDLLVTSEREGYAMRSEPVSFGGVTIHRPGTLLGRALEPLASGTGEILVLLSLQ